MQITETNTPLLIQSVQLYFIDMIDIVQWILTLTNIVSKHRNLHIINENDSRGYFVDTVIML